MANISDDYLKVIRELQNLGKGLPKTASNKFTHAVKKAEEIMKANSSQTNKGTGFKLVGDTKTTQKVYNPKKVPSTIVNSGKPSVVKGGPPAKIDNSYSKMLAKAEEIAKNLNTLYGNGYTKAHANSTINNALKETPDIVKHANRANMVGNTLRGAKKFATDWVPGISDVHDVVIGYNNLKNAKSDSQKSLAFAQMTLGLVGLATLGTGGITKNILKNTAKKAIGKEGVERLLAQGVKAGDARLYRILNDLPHDFVKAIDKTNANVNKIINNPWVSGGGAVGMDVLYNLLTPKANAGELTPEVKEKYGVSEKPGNNKTNQVVVKQPNNNGGNGSGLVKFTPSEQEYLNKLQKEYDESERAKAAQAAQEQPKPANELGNNNEAQPTTNEQSVTPQPDMYGVLREWRDRQDYYYPYRRRLSEYNDNYNNLYEQTYARNKALEGMKDFGNPHAGEYTSALSPADRAANKLNVEKALADEMVKPSNEYMTELGNIQLANAIGLSPEALHTDPKIFDSTSDYLRSKAISEANNETKLEIAKRRNVLKAYELELKKEEEDAKLRGDYARARLAAETRLKVQQMSNDGRMMSTGISIAPFIGPEELNSLGTILNMLGGGSGYQQQPQQQVIYQQQPVNPPTQRANVSVQSTPDAKQNALGELFGKYTRR